MGYKQIVRTCTDHDGCVAIACEDEAGNIAWISHGEDSVDPAERVNPDVPWSDGRRAKKSRTSKR